MALLDLLARWKFAGPFYIAGGPSVGYSMRAAYEQAASTWQLWCAQGEVPDFKSNSRLQLGP